MPQSIQTNTGGAALGGFAEGLTKGLEMGWKIKAKNAENDIKARQAQLKELELKLTAADKESLIRLRGLQGQQIQEQMVLAKGKAFLERIDGLNKMEPRLRAVLAPHLLGDAIDPATEGGKQFYKMFSGGEGLPADLLDSLSNLVDPDVAKILANPDYGQALSDKLHKDPWKALTDMEQLKKGVQDRRLAEQEAKQKAALNSVNVAKGLADIQKTTEEIKGIPDQQARVRAETGKTVAETAKIDMQNDLTRQALQMMHGEAGGAGTGGADATKIAPVLALGGNSPAAGVMLESERMGDEYQRKTARINAEAAAAGRHSADMSKPLALVEGGPAAGQVLRIGGHATPRDMTYGQFVESGASLPSRQQSEQLATQHATMLKVNSRVADVLKTIKDKPELLSTPGFAARFVTQAASQVKGFANLLAKDLNPNLRTQVDSISDRVFGRLENVAKQSQTIKNSLNDLVYMYAAARGQTGQGLSNKDVEKFASAVGESVGDPEMMRAVLQTLVTNVEDDFAQSYQTTVGLPYNKRVSPKSFEGISPEGLLRIAEMNKKTDFLSPGQIVDLQAALLAEADKLEGGGNANR